MGVRARRESHRRKKFITITMLAAGGAIGAQSDAAPFWDGYAGNAQHTAVSPIATQSMDTIRWQTPIDLNPVYQPGSGNLYAHYGSPMVTQENTVIVPVKTGADGGFRLEAFDGDTGVHRWAANVATDYALPSHNWVPPYQPVLTPNGRMYYAGAGGTVYYRDNLDASSPSAPTQVAFFGNANYTANPAAYNSNVFICTPLTSDDSGNVYFGYRTTGATPAGVTSGIAKVAPDGTAIYQTVAVASGDAGLGRPVMNCAPAISNDGTKVYMAFSNGANEGVLAQMNTSNLTNVTKRQLKDPKSGNNALLFDDGTASPMIGPNGDVYFGVLGSPLLQNHFRGYMIHMSADLLTLKTPGSFGWDDTASVVPKSMVPQYSGTSDYLLMVKYNNYKGGAGGDGANKVAIIDPNDQTQIDPITGIVSMKEILTILGPTFDGPPATAVREWCINTAVVDPATKSVFVNNEDGKMYRWYLPTNSFTEVITLTNGLGEAYTPTLVGADGSIFAVNNAILFNIGQLPEPGSAAILMLGGTALLTRRRRKT